MSHNINDLNVLRTEIKGKIPMWFGQPQCPVNKDIRFWLEDALEWLGEEFGKQTLLRAEVVLPHPGYFPDQYDGSRENVRQVVDRVCQYMRINPERIALEYYSDKQASSSQSDPLTDWQRIHWQRTQGAMRAYRLSRPESATINTWRRAQGSAGTYRGSVNGVYTIGLEVSRLNDATRLAATIAQELAHVHLSYKQRILPQKFDPDLLADVLTVFFGLGIFSANAAFEWAQWGTLDLLEWSATHQGYLTEAMYGYTLAVFAYLRGEVKPDWITYLEPDVRAYFRQSARYLEKVGPLRLKRWR